MDYEVTITGYCVENEDGGIEVYQSRDEKWLITDSIGCTLSLTDNELMGVYEILKVMYETDS